MPENRTLPEDPRRERKRLLAWYDSHRRDLPWRNTADPYAVWVSEVMLQQTTVTVVQPYWERFLQAFPTVEALARAPEERVLNLWSGLGYYRRARNLRAAARRIAGEGGGAFPSSPAGLRRLPGVGRYTAAAIASICFGLPEAVVDGNVRRVYTRWRAWKGDPGRLPLSRHIEELGRLLIDPRRPGDFNQAVMELGATVCLPRRPHCPDCPWKASCLALAEGNPARYPETPAAPEPRAEHHVALLVQDRRGRFLLTRIPESQHNGGLWSFPAVRLPSAPAGPGAAKATARRFLEEWGWQVVLLERRGAFKHSITRHRITLEVFRARIVPSPRRSSTRAWALPEEAGDLPLAGPARKILRRWGRGCDH